MKNIRLLDCTLRDGGRIINCAFPDYEIRSISERLEEAKIDIIEIGFLRDKNEYNYTNDTTFFTAVNQINPFVCRKSGNVLYSVFVDYGMYDFSTLTPYTGESIDAIRFGFTKQDYVTSKEDIIRCCLTIKEKGYKLFIQGVNSLNYSDKELIEIVEMINEIGPYSFGIVDTYGAMYIDDVDRIYGIIDHNLEPNICINFHSHNNFQLSFGFAQEIIKLSKGTRRIIIDGTLLGMGKVAGNLCTELIADYLVRKYHYDYEIEDILDIIDDHILKYAQRYHWGYSIPAMMAGIYKSHPNNVMYLTNKFRLDTKDIGNILAMIDPVKRQRYDYDEIERLYIEYSSSKVDDKDSIAYLKEMLYGKEIVVLVPGNSINTYKNEINNYIASHQSVVISVNFIAEEWKSIAFYGNQKRYKTNKLKRKGRDVIRCSNIKSDEDDIVVNYQRLINRGHRLFDNSTIMLLNLLKRVGIQKIAVAGFDGLSTGNKGDYMNAEFENNGHSFDAIEINKDIKSMVKEIQETLEGKGEILFLTPSQYSDKEAVFE